MLHQPTSLKTTIFFFRLFTFSQQPISEKVKLFLPQFFVSAKIPLEEINVYLSLRLACVPLNHQQNEHCQYCQCFRPKMLVTKCYIHTYIHTLLASLHGALQSQLCITKLQTKYTTMIKEDKG